MHVGYIYVHPMNHKFFSFLNLLTPFPSYHGSLSKNRKLSNKKCSTLKPLLCAIELPTLVLCYNLQFCTVKEFVVTSFILDGSHIPSMSFKHQFLPGI